MADTKITDLSVAATVALTDEIEVATDPGGTPTSKSATFSVVRAALVPVDLAGADVTGVLPTASVATTLTGKTLTTATIDADQNTITNIDNADIKAAAAIAVSKLAVGNAADVLTTTGGVAVWAAPAAPAAGGSNQQLQYNNAGAFAGIASVVYNGTRIVASGSAIGILNPGGTFAYLLAGSAIVANRTVTFPLLTAGDTFVFEAFTQTLTNKTIAGASNTLTVRIANDVTGLGSGVATALATFSSANIASACTDETGSGALVFGTAPLFKTTINLNNPGDTFKYVITPAAIAADRILNLPLLTGTDTVVTAAFTQTLTNKTLTSPQIDGGRAELDSARVKGEVTNANTTSQNDIPRAAIIRCTGDGLIVTGIDASTAEHGEICELWCIAALSTGIVLKHQNGSSSANNRIITPTAADWNLYEGAVCCLRYDATTLRWRICQAGF